MHFDLIASLELYIPSDSSMEAKCQLFYQLCVSPGENNQQKDRTEEREGREGTGSRKGEANQLSTALPESLTAGKG